MSGRFRIGSGLLLVLTIVHIARADIPGADNPNVFTERTYRQQKLEFNRRTLVEAYKQFGKRDPKWDTQAIALLDGLAQTMANAGAGTFYEVLDQPKFPDLEKLGREALAAGCDDPLVTDMFCITLNDQGKTREIPALVQKAAEGMLQSHYSLFRARATIARALRYTDQKAQAELYQKYQKWQNDTSITLAKADGVEGVELRFVLDAVDNDFDALPLDGQQQFYEDLIRSKADDWITNVIGGKYYIKSAWASRGNGWANAVTPQGWQGMAGELAKAHACLLNAYRMHPDFPEAAANLIVVAMGGYVGPGESLRGWFDRAVDAQFDYDLAYHNYKYAIWPRWHGSFAMMYAFGQECADTKRYDTRVPFVLIDAMHDILNDTNRDWAFMRQPGVIERISEVLSNYAETLKRPDHKPYFYSEAAGMAWQVGRYDVGRAALDKIGGAPSSSGIGTTGAIPMRTSSGIHAFTGANASAVRQAEANVASGRVDVGIEQYLALAKQTPHDDPSAVWLVGRAQELAWQKQFDAGEWVDLTPKPDMAGWYAASGDFSSDGKTITGKTAKDGREMSAELVCGVKFGTRWEMHGDVAMPVGDAKADAADGAGLIYCWLTSDRSCYGYIRPGAQDILFRYDREAPKSFKGRVMPVTNTVAQRWDDNFGLVLRNQTFYKYRSIGEVGTQADPRIGIGAVSAKPGAQFTVTGLQIRKLTQEPKP